MKIFIQAFTILLLCLPVYAAELWSINQPQKDIPSSELTGKLYGKEFELGIATYNNAALKISSKKQLGFWPESELIIFVNVISGQNEWLITPDSVWQVPGVHLKFGKKSSNFPGTFMYSGEYSMRLKVVEFSPDGTVRLKIHISLPDYKESYLIGEFSAVWG